MANNKGDVGKTLKDLGTSQTVKNIAFAAVTAEATEYAGEALGYISTAAGGNPSMYTTQVGANSSINIMDQATSTLNYTQQAEKVLVNASVNSAAQTAIYGGNLGTNFTDSLKTGAIYAVGADASNVVGGMYNGGNGSINEATHLALHAAIGCAEGGAASGNCGAGAIGAGVAEGVADYTNNPQTGQFAALGAALVTGQDAKGIYTANGTAVNALQNNWEPHFPGHEQEKGLVEGGSTELPKPGDSYARIKDSTWNMGDPSSTNGQPLLETEAGSNVGGSSSFPKGGTTTLYRAVSPEELSQIESTGTFEASPNSLQGKFFAETPENATTWGTKLNGEGKFSIIEAEMPTSQADALMRWEKLDSIGSARYGELDQLTGVKIKGFSP